MHCTRLGLRRARVLPVDHLLVQEQGPERVREAMPDRRERVQDDRLRCCESFEKAVRPIEVHQKADAAAVHAIDRDALGQKAMQCLEHETVAAERDDDVGVLRVATGISATQLPQRLLCCFCFGGDYRDAGRYPRRRDSCHPPVTLMWRATAGRL